MTPKARIALVVLAGLPSAIGCNRILGIEQKQPSDAGVIEPGFQLSIAPPRVRVVRGRNAAVDVGIQRFGGFSGAVTVSAPAPPSGLTVDSVSLAPSQTTATITLRASSSAAFGPATLLILGSSVDVPTESQAVPIVVQDLPGRQDLAFGPSMSGRVQVALGTGGQGVGSGGLQVGPTGAIVVCGHARTDRAESSAAIAQLTADGTPDPAFAGSGIVMGNSATSSADACNAMFVRTGGGVTLVGFATPADAGTKAIMVARYQPTGIADQNTGAGGYETTPIDSADSIANGVLPRGDNFIASGAAARGAIVVEYDKKGSPITSFGMNGVATVGPAQSAALWLASQSSGNILAAVSSTPFRIVRLTPVGKVDTSFASGGVASVGDAAATASVVLVAQQPKDAVLAVGTATGPSGFQDIAVVRLTESGELDPTYGSTGWALAPFGGDAFVSSAVLQDDGSVVIAGQTPGAGFSVVRFTAAGELDTTFGIGGRATFDVNGLAQAIALDGLGRILVAGVVGAGNAPDGVVVYRLWP